MASYIFHIPGWHAATVNQLLAKGKWAWTLKKKDREMVAWYVKMARIPPATGKRRLSLTLIMGHRMRTPDPDGVFKSLLDALVKCGALLDDRKECLELMPVAFERAKVKATRVELEDLP